MTVDIQQPMSEIASGELSKAEYDARIQEVVDKLSELRQREMPVTHRFSPGIYTREIFMPADTFVVGYMHKTRHFNVVLSGRALVVIDGAQALIEAGAVFESDAGVQKILYILEDMRWMTIHANPGDRTNVVELEEELIVATPELLSEKGDRTLDEFRLLLGDQYHLSSGKPQPISNTLCP